MPLIALSHFLLNDNRLVVRADGYGSDLASTNTAMVVAWVI